MSGFVAQVQGGLAEERPGVGRTCPALIWPHLASCWASSGHHTVISGMKGASIFRFLGVLLLQQGSKVLLCISWTCWMQGWRRLLRVPLTARRSNQSLLKEINPKYTLEGLMLKLKLWYSGHLMQKTDSLEKTPMLGNVEGSKRRVGWDGWMASLTWWTWVWASSGSWW